MAVSLQSGNLVWQKVNQALANANPSIQQAFKALKTYLATQKGNPDLQFLPFSDADIVTATGYTPVAAACTVYGVYFIKNGTGTGTGTDSWLTLANGASNETDAEKFMALMTSIADQEVYAVHPQGLAFGTDLTISGETSAQDGTESTSGDAGSGFVIIGAA
jgi:hypothetical protein